jgi:hypothetical protein
LRADDAAGAAGAVDHHQRIRRRHLVGHPVDQLRAGAIEGAGDAHVAEFADRTAIDDHDVLAGIEPPLQFAGRDMRCSGAVLD